MPSQTTRLKIPIPLSAEAPDGPSDFAAALAILDHAAIYDQGILSGRPVSTAGTPGIAGRIYRVIGDPTAVNNGIVWLDYGTGWSVLGAQTIVDVLSNRPVATAVPAGTRFFATDQIAEWISDGATWTRLGTQAGETAITLASAATAGKILLQGQAWPSTTGIYADLHTLLGGSNLPDMRQRVPVGYKSGDADFGTLLALGGEKTHVLTAAEMQHDHPIGSINNIPDMGNADAAGGNPSLTGAVQDVTATPHNNLQPFIVVNFEAKL